MSKRRFTQEQINELLVNKNIARCSEKAITYRKEFKVEAAKKYQDEGKSASQIFKDAGFNLDIIGREVPKDCLYDWTRIYQEKGTQGLLTESRGKAKGGGRPRMTWSNDKEKLTYLEAQVAYLKAENAFLAKLRKQRLN